MLQFLKINNFLLFKQQEISLTGNFTVITGETGSGKSMLIKALRFVLGEKTDNLEISTAEISVIAQFSLTQNNHPLKEILMENDLELEDETIILRRTLGPNNKGKVFVNDVPVTLNFLKKVSNELVEFHSQHKQLDSFNQSNSLNIIDQFTNENILLEKVAFLYQEIIKLTETIEAQYKEKQDLEKDKEHLEYSLKEIEILDLKEGEELELIEKKKLFNDKVKILEAIESLKAVFNNKDEAIIQKLLRVQKNIIKLELDKELEDAIETALFHLSELENLAEKKLKEFDANDNIENIEERLSKIKELSRKYRCTADQLLVIEEDYQTKLKKLETINQDIANKKAEKEKFLKEYFSQAEILSTKRKQTAKILEARILEELKQLKLEQVEFKIELISDQLRPIHLKGIDKTTFLIKTNQGFAFAPINEIASGGELSRIMLAFKVALTEVTQKTTIIFDEIDAGTGGAVAQIIGNRLQKLSNSNQIITISHQPQVAAKAKQHLLIQKLNDKIAQTRIKDLNAEDRIQEVARMLAGINLTQSAVDAALSLINDA